MTILASVNNKTVMPGITPIADVPDAPTIGTATAAGLAASITFTAATTGGTPTTYTATSNPGSLTGTASSSPVTVSGLTGDTSYTFTVTAGNSTGTSPSSSASNSITAISPLSGGYDSLATITVPSGGVASVSFTGIPSGYKHLQIRAIARTNRASSTSDSGAFRFNEDGASNYTYHAVIGNGSSAITSATDTYDRGLIDRFSASTASANIFGNVVMDILDYKNTNKFKTVRMLGGYDNNGDRQLVLSSGLWRSTSAITSILLYPNVGTSWQQYSQFTLYGVK